MLVEQSGTSVNGVDMNWLQMQYQSSQQPSFVAQMIMTGNAPRAGMPPMGQPMYQQPMYAQPMYHQQPAKPSGGGFGTFMNVFMGIIGFAAIIGAILWGLKLFADKHAAQTGGKHLTIEGGGGVDNYEQPAAEVLKRKGLDPTVSYPYWPLVYDNAMTAVPDVIFGKVTNYGDKAVKNVTIHFGLYNTKSEKMGMAEDHIPNQGRFGTTEPRSRIITTSVDSTTLLSRIDMTGHENWS